MGSDKFVTKLYYFRNDGSIIAYKKLLSNIDLTHLV
jgi:hypothetical protein